MLKYTSNTYCPSIQSPRGPRKHQRFLTNTMIEDHAIVGLNPVHRASTGSELHLQANILTLSRRRFTGVLDEKVSIGLVVPGCRNVSASWTHRQYHFCMRCFALCRETYHRIRTPRCGRWFQHT